MYNIQHGLPESKTTKNADKNKDCKFLKINSNKSQSKVILFCKHVSYFFRF